VLGANKVGEGSGESEEKIGDIPETPRTHQKMLMLLNQTILGTD
jgi:hypothetical protein